MNTPCRLAVALGIVAALPMDAQAAGAAPPSFTDNRTGWFAGLGLGAIEFREMGGASSTPTYFYVQAGRRFNRYFSLDARAGASTPSVFELLDDPFFGMLQVDLRLSSVFGLHARGILPIARNWDLYAQAGYTYANFRVVLDDGFERVSGKESDHSLSWGVGVSWIADGRWAVDFEYQPALVDGDLWRTQALNLAVRMRF